MSEKNDRMEEILKKASKESTTNTYREADEKKEESSKEKNKAGRKPKDASDLKKTRQVYYSDKAFAEIEACAEALGIEAKTFMQMAINQKVKSCKLK